MQDTSKATEFDARQEITPPEWLFQGARGEAWGDCSAVPASTGNGSGP